MGQKINPKIYRLGLFSNEWDSYYIEKNYEESSLLIFYDLKIREYFSRILNLNGLLLQNCKLRYTEESISISVYYFRLDDKSIFLENSDLIKINNSIYYFLRKGRVDNINALKISLRFRDVSKYKKQFINYNVDSLNKIFRRYIKDKLFEEVVRLSVVTMLINNSSRLLVEFLVLRLKTIKNQNKIIFYLKLVISNLIVKDIFKVNGFKLIINGRFNKSARSRKKDIILGSIALHTIRINLDYFQSPVFTSVGTFGIKLWISRQ